MSPPPTSVAIRDPYPGLRPFDVEEFESFFGRDRQIDELLSRLRDHRFVGVVGLSGSGKSSLVRAGLIHRLQVGHLTSAGSRWHVALFRPGSQPIEALAAALDEILGKLPDRATGLRKSTQELLHSTRAGRSPRENLLVVVDQFEEIFRFQRDKLLSDRDAAHFVDLLLAAEQDLSPDYRVYVVLTMRTDYLGDCAQFGGLPEALNRSQYLVPRLTQEQRREAIEGPAALVDTEIASDVPQALLVESAEGRDTLPLLQHALMRLWERREPCPAGGWQITLAHYQILGGMAQALNDHANDVLEKLPPEKQHLAKKIFQELTEVGQGRDQRRPMRLSELAQRTSATLPDVTAVVEHFLAASFLTSPDRGRAQDWEADISHESLIRQWETLRNWAVEEAQDRDDYLYFAKRVERGGELLTGADLALALQWRDREHSPEWAKRYGGDFAATLALIERSRIEQERQREAAAQEQQRSEEEERRREVERLRLRRMKIVVTLSSIVCIIMMSMLIMTYRFSQQAAVATRASKARELAALALAGLSENPERSILLGILAVKATLRFGEATVPAAWDALQRAILSLPVHLTLRGHSGSVLGVAYSPDGKRLATCSQDGKVKVWDAGSGQELLTLRGHLGSVLGVAFSPDGTRLATASEDGTVKVWDAGSGQELLTLRGHLGSVLGVAYSPDGTRLATASQDGTVKVWDAGSGKTLLTLRGHSGSVLGVAYSPDGKRLATCSQDGKVKVWD
ncbi:MAG TPA: WD40 repeat domain-containing protein, partial [Terriglobales bacterium]|nr:WD40 repeat domain-containing protein [Terriglobales bacterium]